MPSIAAAFGETRHPDTEQYRNRAKWLPTVRRPSGQGMDAASGLLYRRKSWAIRTIISRVCDSVGDQRPATALTDCQLPDLVYFMPIPPKAHEPPNFDSKFYISLMQHYNPLPVPSRVPPLNAVHFPAKLRRINEGRIARYIA